MAKISLRAYNRDIENLIDRGQTEEAIAQCRYILKVFPKYIDTYRLLGKTYLESQRYTEAADVLQRVLSAVPDDFVSQLGMSIIREDEGNLDASIWHMERAYEIQPSNTAVQDELRRLYGRRDGVEPPKVRLTRGALVRMYARGDLYPQAIAEARAALAEAPHRIDLEIILARMYFLSNLKVEAAEVSGRLVSKLPYCYEANRILAEILPETSRADDAKAFQQTVSALDPYYTFISPNAPTPDMVPDNAVTLEQMDWEPGAEMPEQPAWASTIGVKLQQEPEDEVPDWLSAIRGTKATEQPEETADDFFASKKPQPTTQEPAAAEEQFETPIEQMPAAEPADENDIPEWMRSAGWSESNGIEQEPAPISFDEEEEEIGNSEPLPADIPDWLKSLAPEEEDLPTGQNDHDRLDMLASLLPMTEDDTTMEEPSPATEVEPAPLEEDAEAEPDQTEAADLPDWLREMEITSSSTTIIGPEDELAEWFSSKTEEAGETLTPTENETEPVAGQPVEPAQATEAPAETFEEAQQPPQAETAAVSSEELVLPADVEDLDAAMAWLELLAAQHGAEEETLITRPEDRLNDMPGWVREEAVQPEPEDSAEFPSANVEESPEAALAEAAEAEMPVTAEAQAEETTDSTGALAFETPQEEAETLEMPETEMTGAQVFETPVEAVDEPELQSPPNAVTELEEAITAAEALTFDVPEKTTEEPAVELPAEAAFPSMPDLSDEAAAFAWLESLAAQQGAEEETLLNKPEDRLDKAPEWVQEEAEAEEASPGEQESEPVETAAEEPQAVEAELPAWLDEIAKEEGVPEAVQEEAEAEEASPGEQESEPVETAAE